MQARFLVAGCLCLGLIGLCCLCLGVVLACGTILEVGVQPDKQFATARALLLPGGTSSVLEGLLGKIHGIISSIPLRAVWQMVTHSLESAIAERTAVLGGKLGLFTVD